MAVRLRPQSAAWMAPHALAAQLTAQTGQIAGQGVAGLLGGIAQGVGAFTQKREARRAEAINESRYQDSLGMRREEMDLRKQQAALEDTQGRYAILSQAQKGVDVKLALWELNNPGAPPPPELLSEKEQLSSSLKAVMAGAMKGVPMPQATARAMPATGVVVNGKPMSEMTDAELNDLMDKSARGEVDYSYRGGATGDMGQGVGGTPKSAAAPSRMVNDGGVMSGGAAPEVAAPGMPDVPSSGDPVADRFTAEMGRLSASIQEMEDRADKIEKLGPGSSRLRSQIAEAKTRLLTMQGRYQVYSADRTKRQSQEMQAEDEARKQAQNKARVDAYNEQARKTGQREIVDVSQIGPVTSGEMTDARAEANRAFKEQQAELRRAQQDKMELRRRSWAVEDRDIREGRMNAKDAATMAQRDVAEAGRAVNRAQDQLKALNDSFRANKATKEELTEAANDLTDAKDFYDQAVKRRDGMGGAAPQAATTSPTADPKASAAAEFKALPKEQQTLEVWTAIKAKHGIK